jgi:hypothetical protein
MGEVQVYEDVDEKMRTQQLVSQVSSASDSCCPLDKVCIFFYQYELLNQKFNIIFFTVARDASAC